MPTMAGSLEVSLRASRLAAGLSQEVLAQRAHISRQAYLAIESGRAAPSTEVALRLARALGRSVEDLFHLAEAPEALEAQLVGPLPPPGVPTRVRLARVNERLLAWPLVGARGLVRAIPRADGLAQRGVDGRARVHPLIDPGRLGRTLVAVGCDPALALVAEHLRRRSQVELAWSEAASAEALATLARGEAHVAGSHLHDVASGSFNLPFVRRLVPFPCTVVTFAVWEEGLVLAPGNPKQVRRFEDVARPGLRLANREPGSGSRALLDAELAALGIAGATLPGYDTALPGHLAVAEVVALGLADVGVAVRAAANALGLDFLPLRQERYDLVIPNVHLDHPGVLALLEALKRRSLRTQIEALGGYDVAEMGTPRAA